MVMPNIGAFITWDFIAAFFIPTGWFPNETINSMVGPMLTYLLPILIDYTGGRAIGGQKGAVTGALATLGAMTCGPLDGLVAASPGSIIVEMLMTSKGGYFANILGIVVACVVSFLISTFLLRFFGKDADLAKAQAQVAASKAASKGQAVPAASSDVSLPDMEIKKIVFACDAGMGSSAMGATMVRNKIKEAGIIGIEVIRALVSEIPGDCQIVVTHHELAARAASSNPSARIIPTKNFMGAPECAVLIGELVAKTNVEDIYRKLNGLE